ncbi:sodium-independent anion transporter [Marinifilum breve]|uniref:Sodium-independent anion transporter n=1 Tax=Marinifilum breve TaxID=2184082 RepID=A0A2V4A1T2_9BACT|nr:sulfate permease [Marinifilum breve]PXY02626.1 sodium-independent anion transporter [Marinifilum breve]
MKSIFKPKLFSVLKGYNSQSFQKDLFAGIIVGIVALPLAIAFAVASGVSPEKGLITAIIAGFLISLLGGSRVQIGGPTGAFIVIVYGIVSQYGLEGLMISTFLAGIMLVLFGLLRLGAILKFIPHPLIVGFTSGIALVIFSTQIKAAFGLDIDSVPSEFIEKWMCYFSNLDSINVYAIAISVGTILISLYAGKLIPKIPGSFIAIIAMTVMVQVLELPVSTIESIYGEIPNSISFDMPSIDWSLVHNYFQPALTIAILGAIESLLSAVVADGMIGGNHRSNTELIAQGIANIFSPIFGGIPATGAIARTATNVKNGGRTPVAGIVHAFTLLLIMLVFGKWAKLIPMSCLAGILIVVSYNMSEWRSFRSILKGSRFDIIVLLTTFFLTVLVDLTVAIEFGIVLAALIFMYRMSKINGVMPVETESDEIQNYNLIPKEIEIYEISGPFFFAAAKRYQETLRELKHSTSVLIIRMRHVPFIDATGIRNFTEIIKNLANRKTKVILSGVNKEVRQELERCEIADYISDKDICDNFEEALKRAKEKI